jgi:hypothetical protein
MRSFAAADFLALWERGAGMSSVDRALLVLNRALPDAGYDTLAKLSLGRRDRCLLEVRRKNFGDRLDSYTECPNCRERLEFSLSCSALLGDMEVVDRDRTRIMLDGMELELRCPNSADAAAMASSATVEMGTEILLARCVDFAGNRAMLTPARRAAIAEALSDLDPAAEILLDLSCAACRHAWQTLFDIEKFLWTELCARARRLLQEVDALARVYHWNETEILGMSEARRGLYLEMALA